MTDDMKKGFEEDVLNSEESAFSALRVATGEVEMGHAEMRHTPYGGSTVFVGEGTSEGYDALGEALGINLDTTEGTGTAPIGPQRDEMMRLAVDKRISEMHPEEIDRLKEDLIQQEAEDYRRENGDKQYKEYEGLYEERWTTGLTKEFIDKQNGAPNAAGVRQVKRNFYALNTGSTTGSQSGEQWIKGFKDVVVSSMSQVIPAGVGSDPTYSNFAVFDRTDDVGLGNDELKKLMTKDEHGNYPFEVVGFYFDSTGISLGIDYNYPEGGTRSLEIRNKTSLNEYLDYAGFQDKAVLNTMEDILKSSQDVSQEYTQGISSLGQTRGNLSGVVNVGGSNYTRPYSVAQMDGDFEGMDMKEGQFAYFSLKEDRWTKHDDPYSLGMAMHVDKAYFYEVPANQQIITSDSFGDAVEVDSLIMSRGDNTLSKEVYDGISYLAAIPGANMRITSATRDINHEASKKNPHSDHIWGDAVDMSVKTNGEIDFDKIDFFHAEADNLAATYRITTTLEFPESYRGTAEYAKAYSKYGADMVSINRNTNSIHLHLEHQRQY